MSSLSSFRSPSTVERKRIRVLVVDDSAPQRMMLVALLNGDPELEVIAWAAEGAEGVRAAARHKPDVITMDLRMPNMDGLEATRHIMQETPTRVVMVTASVSRTNQQLVFQAYDAGVLAVLEKPKPGPAGEIAARELLRTVKSMSQVPVIRRWAANSLGQPPPSPPLGARAAPPPIPAARVGEPAPSARPTKLPNPPRSRVRPLRRPEIVAIGASTGGPQALRDVLSSLPPTFSLPILVVQHIAVGFTSGLVDWLGYHCALPIQAVDSDVLTLQPGIYVAPAGRHLVARHRSLALAVDPLVSGHRPSATVLFQSVAKAYGAAAIGVLLTGMGDDGAAGLRDLKRVGAVTIAQDEESSVVFGMPAAAIAMGVVDLVLPPPSIGPVLVELEERAREV